VSFGKVTCSKEIDFVYPVLLSSAETDEVGGQNSFWSSWFKV